MTVQDNYVPVKLIGNDVTLNFSFNWRVILNTDVQVYLEENDIQTLQTLGLDYTLALNDDNEGGIVSFITPTPGAPTSTQFVLIARETAYTQESVYKTSTGFDSSKAETDWDKSTMLIQQLREEINRQLTVPLGIIIDNILPAPVANALIGYNATEDGFSLFQALAEIPIANPTALSYLRRNSLNTGYDSLNNDAVRIDVLEVGAGNTNKWLKSTGADAEWNDLPVADETTSGILEVATSAEASTGTADDKIMTPLKSAEARIYQLVESVTISNDPEVIFTGLDDGFHHIFEFENIIPATDDVGLFGQISRDGGSSFISTADYSFTVKTLTSSATTEQDNFNNASTVLLLVTDTATWGIKNTNDGGNNGMFIAYNPSQGTSIHRFRTEFDYGSTNHNSNFGGSAITDAVTAYDAIRFFAETGNLTSGVIKHYIIK